MVDSRIEDLWEDQMVEYFVGIAIIVDIVARR